MHHDGTQRRGDPALRIALGEAKRRPEKMPGDQLRELIARHLDAHEDDQHDGAGRDDHDSDESGRRTCGSEHQVDEAAQHGPLQRM